MPKLKTHSGAKKRFNLTKSGKVPTPWCYQIHPGGSKAPPGADRPGVGV